MNFRYVQRCVLWNELPHDKTNKMACAPSKDSDQPGHLLSLISVFAVRMNKAQVLSYPLSAQRRLWSDWVDAQADLCLRWVYSHFIGFVMRQLKFCWASIKQSAVLPGRKNLFIFLTKNQVVVSIDTRVNTDLELFFPTVGKTLTQRWTSARCYILQEFISYRSQMGCVVFKLHTLSKITLLML